MDPIQESPQGVILNLYIQPKASKNKVVGRHGDAIKLQITAPPVDGEANEAVIKFLAQTIEVPRSQVEILSGHQGRRKRVLIKGINSANLPESLLPG